MIQLGISHHSYTGIPALSETSYIILLVAIRRLIVIAASVICTSPFPYPNGFLSCIVLPPLPAMLCQLSLVS